MAPPVSRSGPGACHLCGSTALQSVGGYESLRTVTSDCKPWRSGVHLLVCDACDGVQKLLDARWREDVAHIYQAYSVYHQGDGAEQMVFDGVSGRGEPRSTGLVRGLERLGLPRAGRLLDVGCGNGAFLRVFSEFAPGWTLAGIELGDKYRHEIESIRNVEALYTCPLDQIPGTFDVITMIHVLEHIPQPREFLTYVWGKLAADGLFVAHVPDYTQNPFDLLIADHCTHFSARTARALVSTTALRAEVVAVDWVAKELSVLAQKTGRTGLKADGQAAAREPAEASAALTAVRWLKEVRTEARKLAASGRLGLFGTSVAATWLFSELGGSVAFFVDEDPHRIGTTYMGRPVFSPDGVPEGSKVFLALPPLQAAQVYRRLRKIPVLCLPPALT